MERYWLLHYSLDEIFKHGYEPIYDAKIGSVTLCWEFGIIYLLEKPEFEGILRLEEEMLGQSRKNTVTKCEAVFP